MYEFAFSGAQQVWRGVQYGGNAVTQSPPPPTDGFLLQEDGFFLLQEDGSKILIQL